VSPRTRFLSFGASALLVVISVLVALLVSGITGEAISIALGSLGLIAMVSLAFLEVGLSEDRARARDRNDRRERTPRRPMRPRRRRPD
jgi:hypothetical protein